jgi:hypothetical protein
MKNGIGWVAAGLGALLCLACCVPPLAAVGRAAVALALGFLAGWLAGALLAIGLIAVVVIVVATSRMRRRAPRSIWPERAEKERAAGCA